MENMCENIPETERKGEREREKKEHIIQPWNNLEPLKVQLGVGGPCGMAAFKSDCINMGHLLRYQFHEIFF